MDRKYIINVLQRNRLRRRGHVFRNSDDDWHGATVRTVQTIFFRLRTHGMRTLFCRTLTSLCDENENEKSARRRRKHCALAVVLRGSQTLSLRHRPLPGGAGRPKFNQLEMVTTFTYKPSLVMSTQFRVIVVTDPQTHATARPPQTGPITMHCAAPLSSARSVKMCSFGLGG